MDNERDSDFLPTMACFPHVGGASCPAPKTSRSVPAELLKLGSLDRGRSESDCATTDAPIRQALGRQ